MKLVTSFIIYLNANTLILENNCCLKLIFELNESNALFFKQILNETDERKLINLAKFLKYVLDYCKNPPG